MKLNLISQILISLRFHFYLVSCQDRSQQAFVRDRALIVDVDDIQRGVLRCSLSVLGRLDNHRVEVGHALSEHWVDLAHFFVGWVPEAVDRTFSHLPA